MFNLPFILHKQLLDQRVVSSQYVQLAQRHKRQQSTRADLQSGRWPANMYLSGRLGTHEVMPCNAMPLRHVAARFT